MNMRNILEQKNIKWSLKSKQPVYHQIGLGWRHTKTLCPLKRLGELLFKHWCLWRYTFLSILFFCFVVAVHFSASKSRRSWFSPQWQLHRFPPQRVTIPHLHSAHGLFTSASSASSLMPLYVKLNIENVFCLSTASIFHALTWLGASRGAALIAGVARR